ncbi:MAG: hypothetical protein FJW94_04355 [Actinobacteria bacterium]|nr:hypothetical protein [Actinomycetota bacterium]
MATGVPTSALTEGPSGDGPDPLRSDSRLRASVTVAAVMVWTLFAVLVTYGRFDVVHPETFGNFYDAQARALLDGRLAVDPNQVGFEGFQMDGATHIYQGLVPTIGRLPVMVVTDRLDGRLTSLSMLAAMAVALGHVAVLVLVARRLVRGPAPVGRGEVVALGATVAAAGGSSLLFLGSKAWVYHEALLWGVAFALASGTHLLRWIERGRLGRADLAPLVWSGGFAVLAVHSRFSTGLGALVSLGLVGLTVAAVALRPALQDRVGRIAGLSVPVRPLPVLAVLVATAVVSLGSYAAVNQARFQTPFGLPIERQGVASSDPEFRAALAANGGSLFGLRYSPSVLVQLLRPDALRLRGEFPYLGLPLDRPTVVGDALFAERDRSTSLPVAAPWVLATAVLGLWAAFGPRRWSHDGAAAAARPVVVGAATAAGGIVVLGYIANRYQADLLPALAVASAVGAAALVGRTRPGGRGRRVVAGLAVLGALWGIWVNAATAVEYQREVAAGAWDGSRSAWLSLQTRLGPAPDVLRVPESAPLPPAGPLGRVAVVGDCDAVYRSNGDIWILIDGGPAAGAFRLTIRSTGDLTGPVPILEGVGPEGSNRLVVEPDGPPGLAHLQIEVDDGTEVRKSFPGPAFRWTPGTELELSTELDWRTDTVEVRDSSDRRLLGATVDLLPTGDVTPAGGPEVEVSASARGFDRCGRLVGP